MDIPFIRIIIAVLVMLLSGNAYAEQIPNMNNSIWNVTFSEKWTLNFKEHGRCTYSWKDIWIRTDDDCHWKQNENLVELGGNDGFFTIKLQVYGNNATGVFTNIRGEIFQLTGNATYVEKWLTSSLSKEKKSKPKKKKTTKKTVSSTTSSQSLSTDPKIVQAKQICKDLGFKTNTEKFADCALKMMSMQFEAGNRVATSSGGTKQEITLKHKQDYDIFDAMIDVSNVMRQSNSSSSSGRGKCRIFQSAYHADLICR